MTTNTTPSTASQAASILSHEFTDMMYAWAISKDGTPECSKAWIAIIDHINAKLAQAREEAIGALAIAFEKMLCAAVGRDWSTSGISASSLVEELRSCAEKAEARATAAEAKLEAIRQGVEGLSGYDMYADPMEGGELILREEVLALLTTPPKADESGLPG